MEKQETDAWAAEFQSNLAELEKTLKTTKESPKPGSIHVKVANAQRFESVVIRLNDKQVKEIKGVSECLIENIPPGNYEVSVTAAKDGKSYQDNRIVEVPSVVVLWSSSRFHQDDRKPRIGSQTSDRLWDFNYKPGKAVLTNSATYVLSLALLPSQTNCKREQSCHITQWMHLCRSSGHLCALEELLF